MSTVINLKPKTKQNPNYYEQYKQDCLKADLNPLTKREWEIEGRLNFTQSLRKSRMHHRRKFYA